MQLQLTERTKSFVPWLSAMAASSLGLLVTVLLLLLIGACDATRRSFLSSAARDALINSVAAAPAPAFSVNVYDYGAAGDGKTDDTNAFQSALNVLTKCDLDA